MASPHVAGVAALIRQLDPTLTPAEVTRVIAMQALSDVITDVGPGSPNLLLQVPSLTCELPPLAPPSTFAPTSWIHTFYFDLTTDSYASETSWDLKDPSGSVIAMGSGYENDSAYTETVCIDDGEYTFTIYDSYGDGICCGYGNGLYSLQVDDDPVIMLENGGSFTVSQSTTFGNEASASPSLEPSPSPSSSPSATTSVVPSFSPSVESSASVLPSSPPNVADSESSPSPSIFPSSTPSRVPSLSPSLEPTTSVLPSSPPSVSPTLSPSKAPSPSPSSAAPVPTDPPTTLPTAPSWTEILSDDFENGWGDFNDGGKDGFLDNGHSHSNGSYSALIRDDSDQISSIYSDPFQVSNYSMIKVEFWYVSLGFDNNQQDSFYLETRATGSNSWSTIHTWVYGEHFDSNSEWRYASVEVEVPVGSSNLQIRFRNNGDGNSEKIFIDEVVVSGKQ